jgi:hypothetical protein
VDLRPAWHAAGDFFTDKEIRMLPQYFGASDGVMIGKSDEIHAALSQRGVDVGRRAVTLKNKMTHNGCRDCAGMNRVDVQVAFHSAIMVSDDVCKLVTRRLTDRKIRLLLLEHKSVHEEGEQL